jgi:Family of unknown function (DUF5681)
MKRSTPANAEPDADPKPGRRLFQKGQSGNPTGKKPGTRHKATIIAETLLDGESEALTRKPLIWRLPEMSRR